MESIDLISAEAPDFGSHGVHMTQLARFTGFRVHVAVFAPGAVLGKHPTRIWQLFRVQTGAGWMSTGDDPPVALHAGDAILLQPGELHESGSEDGMTVVIVQSDQRLPSGVAEDLDIPNPANPV